MLEMLIERRKHVTSSPALQETNALSFRKFGAALRIESFYVFTKLFTRSLASFA
jgi:hypothetical protein